MLVNSIASTPQKHILLTTAPVVKKMLKEKHPELFEEFQDGSFVCGRFPASYEELLSLVSEPGMLVVVASDGLDPDQIAKVCLVRSKTSRGFYVYSQRDRSLEFVSKDFVPGKNRVTIG